MSTRWQKWLTRIGLTALIMAIVGATLCYEEVTDFESDNGLVLTHRNRLALIRLDTDGSEGMTGWYDDDTRLHHSFRTRIITRYSFFGLRRTQATILIGPSNIMPPRGSDQKG